MPDKAAPILDDRARKYGRNLMAAAGAILALAYLPGVGIEQFKFFGLEFKTAPGSQFSFWCLMAAVLAYFALRYWVDARIDYLASYFDIRDHEQLLKTEIEHIDVKLFRVSQTRAGTPGRAIAEMRPKGMEIRKFWILDAGLPLGLAIAAAITAGIRITDHWPPGTPPTP